MIVDLGALCRNYERVRCITKGACRILAVVKGDAYGHGAIAVSKTIARLRDSLLGVALVQEAIQLRDANIHVPIVVLHEPYPDEFDIVLRHEFSFCVSSNQHLDRIADTATKVGRRARVHLRLDTGLGPPGLQVKSFTSTALAIRSYSQIDIEGLFTHVADPSDEARTQDQLRQFRGVLRCLRKIGVSVPLVHVAATGMILRYSSTHFDAVRPGTMLYGRPRLPETGIACEIEDIATWATQIVEIETVGVERRIGYGRSVAVAEQRRIAIIPVGYADGLRKGTSERRQVLVRGRRASVIGRAAMDFCYVDVTDIPNAGLEDEVVILGAQGRERISASEVGSLFGVPTPEVWCGISSRVPRVYVGEAPVRAETH